jgi:hypothetical protein
MLSAILTNGIGFLFVLGFFYYNIANYVNQKKFEIAHFSFFLLNVGILSLMIAYIVGAGDIDIISFISNYILNLIDTYILSFFFKYSVFIMSTAIILLFLNIFIKSHLISIILDLLCLSIFYYFIIGVFFIESGHLDNSPMFSLVQEITNSKLSNISELMVSNLVIQINMVSSTLLFIFLILSFSNTPSLYFMSYPKYFFYRVKLPILRLQVKVMEKGIVNFEKYILKHENFEKKIGKNKFNSKTINDLKTKKNKRIKETNEIIDKIKTQEVELINIEQNLISLYAKTKRFKLFTFINGKLYIFMLKNKKYLLVFAILLEIINNFIQFTDRDVDFHKLIISQTYYIFILFIILILFNNRNILKFIRDNKIKIVFNVFLMTFMLLVQDYFYKIIEVNLLNAFIITILYSMRDSIFKTEVNTFEIFIILMFYTLHNILLITMIGNIPAKEAIVFFNSIIIIMVFNKKLIQKYYEMFYEKISDLLKSLKT